MEDALKNLVFAFVLITAFSVAILSAVIYQANLYGKDANEVTQGSLDITPFNNTLSNLLVVSQSQQESVAGTNETSNSANIGQSSAIGGMITVGISMMSMVTLPFKLIAGIMTNVLHVPSYIISTILTLVILALIFGLYSLWKWGR